MLNRIINALSFEPQKGEYELLETERGEPGYLGGWREAPPAPQPPEGGIPKPLSEVEERWKRELRRDINPDLIVRRFMLGKRLPAMAVFINGMVDTDAINDFVLRDGMRKGSLDSADGDVLKYIVENVFTFCEVEITPDWGKAKTAVLDGKTAVFFENEDRAIVMDTRGYERRTVSAPQNEQTVKGPQEGFVENLRTNITLIRRIVRTDDLVCEFRNAGGDNNVKLAILYREGVTNATLVEEVKRRLAIVDTRMVMAAGTLEQYIEQHSFSPFPQMLATERPDRTSGFIMQGHVVVLLEGSPFANITPTTLHTLMSSPEDAYLREPQGTVVRVVRYTGAILSILLPAYFLALAMHHQGLLSVEVLSTLVSSRKMVFAPLGSEMLFLLIVFQLIREAGLRVPGRIGQAIGIIGGLILGQAAVSANLASSVVLIVVALSGLGNFCIPDYSTQIATSYIRIALVVAAWMAGLLGVICLLVLLLGGICSLKSFGVPFLAPFAPKTYSKYPLIRRGQVTMHRKATDFTNTREERR